MRSRITRVRRIALRSAAAACLVVTLLPATASAGEPMTFVQMVGRPRHATPEGVSTDASGNVYVADSNTSGTSANDRVVKYDANGVFLDVIAGPGTIYATPGPAQVSDPTSVAVAPSGDVYVVERGGDRVQRFDSSGIYLGTWGADGTGNGQFRNPEGIAVDSLNNVYVADFGNDRIQKFDAAGGWITAWAVNNVVEVDVDATDVVWAVGDSKVRRYDLTGSLLSEWTAVSSTGVAVDGSGVAWVTVPSTIRRFNAAGTSLGDVGTSGSGNGQVSTTPQGIAVAPSGQVYLADTGNGRIQRFSSDGVYQLAWGKFPGAGVLDNPTGLAVDGAGNIYVTNKSQDLIHKFDPSGALLTEWGGSGSGNGKFDDPAAIAIDASGNVYVADTGNQRIQKFDSSGGYLTQWGSYGPNDGQVVDPAGIAVSSTGRVYVADTGNHRIQEFSATGTFVRVWGSNGTGDGQFKSPRGLAVDAAGDVWVADTSNHRIQRFSANGVFGAMWGGTTSSALDGRFSSPMDLDFDALGTLYVVEKGNSRVQRLTTTGGYLSKLGSAGLDIGQFNLPAGMAIDASGRLLVADTLNHRVQVFQDANGPDTTIVTGPPSVSSSSSASFTFSANEPGATFECKLDAGSYSACTSGKSYAGLAAGAHTFSVRAADTLANLGNPATYAWTIDTTPPTVTIQSSPELLTSSTSASFTFVASEGGSVFRCSLDGAIESACSSPHSFTVSSGAHVYEVWAIDVAGNIGLRASYSWTVDTTPPNVSITSGPSGFVVSDNASFEFTSSDTSATFECKLDGLEYAACSSPKNYSGLTPGQHTFSVRGIDTLGNIGTPASRSWTVDAESHRPDGQIATGTTYVGNGVYNSNGKNQTKTLKASPGQTVTFKIRIENDGSDTDPYTVLGTASGKGYVAKYLSGSTDITAQVKAGTYTVNLGPGGSRVLTLKVKLKASAVASRAFLVKATSTHSPTTVDAVKAIVKRV